MKPRVFIGSSSEGREVADNLNISLARDCETVLWHAGAFKISETYIGSLEKALSDVEFAVLVVTADDIREKRGEEGKVPRDNVVFELGLFMGRLGRDHTFIVCDPKMVELPTDLLGLETAEFDSNRSDGNLESAVAPAATKIVRAIRRTPRLASAQTSKLLHDGLSDVDALYGAIVSWPAADGDEVVIQTSDTRWVWKLVPTLVHWRMNGVTVRVFAPPPQPGPLVRGEIARRTLLAELGIDLGETTNLAVYGFFLKTKYSDEDIAIVLNSNPGRGVPLATRYEGDVNYSAVEALHRMLLRQSNVETKWEPFVPTLVAQDTEEVFDLLKNGVKQYRSSKIQIQMDAFPTKDLLLMSPYSRAYKYSQIDRLFNVYRINHHDPFTALAVLLRSGRKSILTPPVVEMRQNDRVVIEGTTRAAYCFQNHIEKYHCIAVSGVEDDLPGTPVPIRIVTTSERSLSQLERTEDYQGALYRHIERATHPY